MNVRITLAIATLIVTVTAATARAEEVVSVKRINLLHNQTRSPFFTSDNTGTVSLLTLFADRHEHEHHFHAARHCASRPGFFADLQRQLLDRRHLDLRRQLDGWQRHSGWYHAYV